MDYDSLKAFILNFYTRYLSSWLLKYLAGFLAIHGVAAEKSGADAQAILEVLASLGVAYADYRHSKATITTALNTLPPKDIVSVSMNAVTGAVTTTAEQTKPGA